MKGLPRLAWVANVSTFAALSVAPTPRGSVISYFTSRSRAISEPDIPG
jgi:hypothetical protein